MRKPVPLTNAQRLASSRQRRLEELEQLRQFKADAESGQALATAQLTIEGLTSMVTNLQAEVLALRVANFKVLKPAAPGVDQDRVIQSLRKQLANMATLQDKHEAQLEAKNDQIETLETYLCFSDPDTYNGPYRKEYPDTSVSEHADAEDEAA